MVHPESKLRKYAPTKMPELAVKPGPAANCGNTKHPAPTVLPVTSKAADKTGPPVVCNQLSTDDEASTAAGDKDSDDAGGTNHGAVAEDDDMASEDAGNIASAVISGAEAEGGGLTASSAVAPEPMADMEAVEADAILR